MNHDEPLHRALNDATEHQREIALVYADWCEDKGNLAQAEQLRELLENCEWHPFMRLCWCPPGRFLMGSPTSEPDRKSDEDQKEVRLTQGYWLGKYPVTQEEYERIIGKNPSSFTAAGPTIKQLNKRETNRFPVVRVSWGDAVEFCLKLTEQERRKGRLGPGWEYGLPTEAEWEYACRAGTTTATAFGDSLSSAQANFNGNPPYNGARKGPALGRPSEVGSYPSNKWGLCDMHGNVWEWCQDWYASHLQGGDDPRGPASASYRVLRGGSWDLCGRYCRSAFRIYNPPASRFNSHGFRVSLRRAHREELSVERMGLMQYARQRLGAVLGLVRK